MAKKFVRDSATVSSAVSTVLPAVEGLIGWEEACRRLGGISRKTLQRLCQTKQINYVKISDSLYKFRPVALALFVAKREVKAAA
jgi:hypothetical protein